MTTFAEHTLFMNFTSRVMPILVRFLICGTTVERQQQLQQQLLQGRYPASVYAKQISVDVGCSCHGRTAGCGRRASRQMNYPRCADSWGCCFCDRLPKCRPLLLKLLLLLLDAFCRLRRPRKQAERSEHPHFGHRRRRRRRRPSQPQPVNPAVRPPAGASSVRRKTPYLLRAAATVQSE